MAEKEGGLPPAWTKPDPEPRPQPPPPPPEPVHQQYRPIVPAHAPSPQELLVYCLGVSAEQAKLMSVVQQIAATAGGAAWCNTDGANRFEEWRRANVEAVMRAGAAIGFLVGRAVE